MKTPNLNEKGQLIDLKLFFKLFFEDAATIITIIDTNNNIIMANNKINDNINTNILETEWIKTSLKEKNKLINNINKAKETLTQVDFETYKFQNNEKRYYKTIISPIILDNKVYCIKIEELDITDIKNTLVERDNLIQQLTQSQRLESIGILSGGIAHDFNNILHIILNNIQLLHINNIKDKEKLEKIENIINKGKYLIKQLLFFSRNTKTDKKVININKEIDNVLILLERIIPKTINFILDFDDNIYNILFDKGQLEQIFINLINNSLYVLNDNGKIKIKTKNINIRNEEYFDIYNHKKYICIFFLDNGPGIDSSIKYKIFDPFFTTKPIDKGTGLGLSSTYGIIKEHDGKIQCYSKKNKGTLFKIYLPITEQLIIHEEKNIINKENNVKNILVIDDEKIIADTVKEMLQLNNYNVKVAYDGKTGIQIFKENPDISLILLDLNMPHMNGEQTLIELRKINPDIHIVISTGYISTNIKDKYNVGILNKPYNITTLIEYIKGVKYD